MCPPTHFEVSYAINPWMHPEVPVDPARAARQWRAIRRTFERLGHRVEVLAPLAGQPDMVFAANGMAVVDGRALVSRFRYPQRAGEQGAFEAWLTARGVAFRRSAHVLEGEGDIAVTASAILMGYGFRTELAAAQGVADFLAGPTGRTLVPLELVDPAFYHLDTCLGVLDDRTAVFLPGAFSAASRARLADVFEELIEATPADAAAFGVNVVSDGRHVLLDQAATGLADRLEQLGFVPIGLDTSELRAAGGSVKCCTQELRGLLLP
jgi:N-dimethylarginine dimethylaminohydrolase